MYFQEFSKGDDPNILPLPPSFDHETQVVAPSRQMKINPNVLPLPPITFTLAFVSIVHQRYKTIPIVYSSLLGSIGLNQVLPK